MFLLLATIVGPIVFFLLTWVVATVYRLYFPEEPMLFENDPVVIRERATQSGNSVPVGIREIRADQRRHRRLQAEQIAYQYYTWGGSAGFPEEWREDVWVRRN